MNTKLLVYILSISILLLNNTTFSKPNESATITEIVSQYSFLEDWKDPGLYSPVNVFDNNKNTCTATDNGYLRFEVRFNKDIIIDEIKIINGFGKSKDLFYKNNRVKQLRVSYQNPNSKEKNYAYGDDFKLIDQMEIQSLRFNKPIKTSFIYFEGTSEHSYEGYHYEGLKYNDICLTEIGFYYKGVKIEINNTDKLRKDYNDKLNKALIGILNKGVEFNITAPDRTFDAISGSSLFFLKSGLIKYSERSNPDKNQKYNSLIPPSSWKINDGKLYLLHKDKWKNYRYFINYMPNSETEVYSIYIYDSDEKRFNLSYEFDPEQGGH